jgi:hypothetical protein
LQYKFVLYSSTDQLIGSWDNIVGINSNFVNFVTSEEVQTATADQTVFTLTTMQYQPGTNNLVVYVDGVNQIEGDTYSFVETSSTVVTFVTGLHVGALVKFVSAETLSTGVTSADLVSYEPAGAGAVTTNVQAKLRETVSVKDFGAVGDGVTDDTAAIQAAIDATPEGGTLFLIGKFVCTSALTIPKSITIEGQDNWLGAVSSSAISNSYVGFTNDTNGFELAANANVTFKSFVISCDYSTVGSSTKNGIEIIQTNSTINLQNCVVQKFVRGVNCYQSYYNKFIDSTITNCGTGVYLDNCYNAFFSGMTFGAWNTSTTYGLTLVNGSTVSFCGGSIESQTGYGVGVYSQSHISLFGTYFECFGGYTIQFDTGAAVNVIGCHVFLTVGSTRFISIDSLSSVDTRVFSRNNRLIVPASPSTDAVTAYQFNTSDILAFADVAGDSWISSPGANVLYLGTPTLFSGNVGNFSIQYPSQAVSNYGQNIRTTPANAAPSYDGLPALPVEGVQVFWGNNGNPNDDPIGIAATAYGLNPYQAVFQNGQWEKVGARLPNQVDSVATTVADLKTDFNSLLAKLRANGLMI